MALVERLERHTDFPLVANLSSFRGDYRSEGFSASPYQVDPKAPRQTKGFSRNDHPLEQISTTTKRDKHKRRPEHHLLSCYGSAFSPQNI
jgi:hypothetical protein